MGERSSSWRRMEGFFPNTQQEFGGEQMHAARCGHVWFLRNAKLVRCSEMNLWDFPHCRIKEERT